MWAIVSNLWNAKLRSRLKLIGDDYTQLHPNLPQEQLPTDLGGLAEHDHGAWCTALLAR